ncbi:MAG: DUF3106 domain-containing protein [Planctomycetes bacterium]|nr:DUF3106 domain-containing protein [Planctomycetota bacterium]
MNLLAKIIVSLVALAAFASAFAPQEGTSATLEAARTRWERLSPEDQARFRDRYESYRALSEDERRVLAARAQQLRETKARLRDEMSDEMRAKIAQLEPKKREFVLNELARDEVRERGARIREKLPETLVDRLEQATPEERARYLAEFQQRARARFARFAIEKMGRKLQLPPEEIERLKDLTGAERAAGVLDLAKRLAVKEVADSGLPPGLEQAEWEALRALPPAEFVEAFQKYRREHAWRGSEQRPDGARGPGSVTRKVLEALRAQPAEVLEFTELPADVRRQRLFELRRERVCGVLREHGSLPAEKLAEMSALSESEFFKALRAAMPHPPERHGHRGGRAAPDSRPRQD